MILRSPKDREYYYGTGEHAGNPNAIAKRQKPPPPTLGSLPRILVECRESGRGMSQPAGGPEDRGFYFLELLPDEKEDGYRPQPPETENRPEHTHTHTRQNCTSPTRGKNGRYDYDGKGKKGKKTERIPASWVD